jgi:hypothetical protein
VKIRIIQKGWENFTGNFGGLDFVESESVADVDERQAGRVANVVKCEMLDGTNPSASQQALDQRMLKPHVELPTTASAVTAPTAVSRGPFTRAELEDIAGELGIKGLRVISDPLGVKATGISDLIDLILKSQTPETPAFIAPAVVPAEVVAE